MNMIKKEVNFTISERVPTAINYSDFEKDFLDPNIRVDELKEKYSLTPSEYREYRDRALNENNLLRKPTYYGRDTQVKGETFIQKKHNGYVIAKTINNSTGYYGRYRDIDTARFVRDKLIESDWDEMLAYELKKKYGIKRRKPSYYKAINCYAEFESLYFDFDYSINEIKEKMGLTNRVYLCLLEMIKKNYGKLYRRK